MVVDMMEYRKQLEWFYLENRQRIMACALSVTGNADIAEDAVQDAFYKLLRINKTPQYLTTYVMRAVYHAAIDRMRNQKDTVPLEHAEWFLSHQNPGHHAEEEQFQRNVESALKELGDDERQTIIQHMYAGMSFREIAEMRQIPTGTVASWYSRGMQKLRQTLRKKLGDHYE